MTLSFDYQYIKIAKEILTEGTEVIGRNNLRYKQMFGQTIKIDLREGFPALTIRKMPVRNLFREFMWDVNGNSVMNHSTNSSGSGNNFAQIQPIANLFFRLSILLTILFTVLLVILTSLFLVMGLILI
jgi:hypothetical protein